MKKIDYYKNIISENIDNFKCPNCGESFKLKTNAIICDKGHCFDIAGKGYLNFMTGLARQDNQYDKNLFESRQYTFEKGFFDELLSEVKNLIYRYSKKPKIIADLGCGEGSLLEQMILGNQALGVGIDISKQGINIATARQEVNALWVVGDLAKIPFKEKTFDVIINMLSPANYSEFARTLADEAIIVKILPGEDYLKQIRTFFYKGTLKENYSNDRTADYFSQHFNRYIEKNILYNVKMDEKLLESLMKMSPLSSSKEKADIDLFMSSGVKEITADFKILVGFSQ